MLVLLLAQTVIDKSQMLMLMMVDNAVTGYQ